MIAAMAACSDAVPGVASWRKAPPPAVGRSCPLASVRRAHMHVESIPDETELPERTAGDRDELFVNGLLAGRGPGGRRGGACRGRRLTHYAETLS